MSNCPICRRSMLKFNLEKYGMCFTCYMKNKMSENNCGGTAKGSGNSELGNNSEESHITTSSQESSPQKEVKEILNDINKAIKVWDNYQEAKVFHCPFNKDKCEEIKQAREEMQEEIKKFKQELITKYHTYGSIFADELDIFMKQPGEGEKK